MAKTNLVEVTKGKTGYGLLIENDGFISMEEGSNKAICENFLKEDKEEKWFCPFPFRVKAVFQKYGIKNANGRIYPENILRREVEKYQQKIKNKNAYGEETHPQDIVINSERIAINIVELHWEGHTLVGEMDIIVSEGFRRHGIISCRGDNVANLLLNGLKLGVSSRGIGSVSQVMGQTIVGSDYDLVCWDVVTDPSTPNAYISPFGEDIPTEYMENTDKKGPVLTEDKFAKFNDWLLLN